MFVKVVKGSLVDGASENVFLRASLRFFFNIYYNVSMFGAMENFYIGARQN